MRSRSICTLAAALLVVPLVGVDTAMADPATYWGTMTNASGFYYGGQDGGGEFRWTTNQGAAGKGDATLKGSKTGPSSLQANQFLTFCVETTEHIDWNETVYSFTNDESKNTNVALTNATAYLYTQFVTAALSSYNYADVIAGGVARRTADANSLQHVIWYFQSQVGLGALDSQADAWRLAAIAAVGGTGFETDNIGRVRILNNWTGANNGNPSGSVRQDMLVMIPLPAPVWMAGLGLFGVVGGTIYRRRSGTRGGLTI